MHEEIAGITSLVPLSTSSRWACLRQNMLSLLSVSTSCSGVALVSGVGFQPPVLLVPQLRFIRRAAAGSEAGGGRVVLDDVVVPVEDPDVPVRPDLGHDR